MKKINENEWYSSWKIIQMGILPWNSAMTFNKRLNENKYIAIFNPLVVKVGKRKFYKIRGKYIIKFLKSIK